MNNKGGGEVDRKRRGKQKKNTWKNEREKRKIGKKTRKERK